MPITRCKKSTNDQVGVKMKAREVVSDPRHDNVPDVVVGQVVLREGDVGCHHHPDPAGDQPVLVEDDTGGDHEARVREEPGVVNIEKFP